MPSNILFSNRHYIIFFPLHFWSQRRLYRTNYSLTQNPPLARHLWFRTTGYLYQYSLCNIRLKELSGIQKTYNATLQEGLRLKGIGLKSNYYLEGKKRPHLLHYSENMLSLQGDIYIVYWTLEVYIRKWRNNDDIWPKINFYTVA